MCSVFIFDFDLDSYFSMIPIAILIFLYFFLVLLLVALIDMYVRAYLSPVFLYIAVLFLSLSGSQPGWTSGFPQERNYSKVSGA